MRRIQATPMGVNGCQKLSTSTVEVNVLVQIGRVGQLLHVIADYQPALPAADTVEFNDPVADGFSRDNEHLVQGDLNHWAVVTLKWSPEHNDVVATASRMGEFVGKEYVAGCLTIDTEQKNLAKGAIVLTAREVKTVLDSIEVSRLNRLKRAVATMYKHAEKAKAKAVTAPAAEVVTPEPTLEAMSVEAVVPSPVEIVIEPVKAKGPKQEVRRRGMPSLMAADASIADAEKKIEEILQVAKSGADHKPAQLKTGPIKSLADL